MLKKIFVALTLFVSISTHASTIDDLEKKARQGDSESQFRLGFLYENGSNNIVSDFREAEFWYLKSKNDKSYSRLAVMSFNEGDYEKSKKYLTQPLNNKFPYAFLYYGKILNIEGKDGWKYIKYAADKGVPEALFDYGMYMQTSAPKKNNYISYVYLTMANVKGYRAAIPEINKLKSVLQPKQVTSANKRARSILAEIKKSKIESK